MNWTKEFQWVKFLRYKTRDGSTGGGAGGGGGVLLKNEGKIVIQEKSFACGEQLS